jgi:hypothetical protein
VTSHLGSVFLKEFAKDIVAGLLAISANKKRTERMTLPDASRLTDSAILSAF